MTPILSIIVVFKNCRGDLEETLDSVKSKSDQLFTFPTEIIFVDGHSNDGSLEAAERFRGTTKIQTKLIQQDPTGIYPAMNLGARTANGEWLLFLNAGDILYCTDQVFNTIKTARQFNKRAIQFNSGVRLPKGKTFIHALRQWPRCHQAFIYEKNLHSHLGQYDEGLKVCSDTIFLNKISKDLILKTSSVLSVTQVSPSNASRTPAFIKSDIVKLHKAGLATEIFPHPTVTLLVLILEQNLGLSLSVWLRSAFSVIRRQSCIAHLEN